MSSTKHPVAEMGAFVSQKEGTQMVKAFYDEFPALAHGHTIGRNILEKLLAKPGCEGITFFPCKEEDGKAGLVYLAVDADEKPIVKTTVDAKSSATADGEDDGEDVGNRSHVPGDPERW